MIDSGVELYGVKETLNELKQVQPKVYKQLVKDIKKAVSPAVTRIESAVPAVRPLSGMEHNGKTAWGPVKVTTRVTPNARGGSGGQPARLVQIETKSTGDHYGFEIADMAGRGSGTGRRPANMTRPYLRNGKSVSYAKAGQGAALIRNLGGRPSRYVYPSVELVTPQITADVLNSLDVAAASINRKLDRA